MATDAQQSRRLPPMRRLSIQAAVSTTNQPNRIAANVEFFDAILALMPPSVYFGPDDDAKEAGWSKFSRNKQDLAPEQKRKESSKAAKRLARFDPEKAAEATVPGMVASREAEQKRKDREAVAAFTGTSASGEPGTAHVAGKGKKEGEDKVSGWFGDLEAGAGGKKRKRSPDDSDGGEGDSEDEDAVAGPGARARSRTAQESAEYRPRADMSELKEILQAKIALMKAAREGKEGGKSDRKRLKEAAKAAAIEKSKLAGGGKDKNSKSTAAGQPAAGKLQQAGKDTSGKPAAVARPRVPAKAPQPSLPVTASAPASAAMDVDMEGSLSFGAIDTALPAALAAATVSTRDTLPVAALGGAGHGQAGGKTGKLKELLHDARKYQKRLHALEQAGESDQKLSMEFDHALRRAEGEKVRDDPKLIERMLKRKHKEKAGSAQEWKERVKKEEDEGTARQDQRSENVKNKTKRQAKRSERDDSGASGGDKSGKFGGKPSYGSGKPAGQKADKHARRPGFEGRKTGFID